MLRDISIAACRFVPLLQQPIEREYERGMSDHERIGYRVCPQRSLLSACDWIVMSRSEAVGLGGAAPLRHAQ